MENHKFFMQRCLELAQKGFPNNLSNPLVGSIIVHENNIIGEGYHKKYGDNHAEVNAINSVNEKSLLNNSTIYINLEPCAHYGKTPPCSDLIIKHKIPRVVIGCVDPFSKVSGKGIEKLRKEGIKVITGILNEESRNLNKRFITFHEKKRPYIILKWAKSNDGFIAPNNQIKPFWMTTKSSKKLVHQWRSEEHAILIGRITAQKDNPLLNVRDVKGRHPIRIIIDKNLALSNNLKLFNDNQNTIILNEIKSEKINNYKYLKICFKKLIENCLNELYKENIQSIIVEGGKITLQSFIDTKMWDEARIFTTKSNLITGIKSPEIYGQTIKKETIETDDVEILINK